LQQLRLTTFLLLINALVVLTACSGGGLAGVTPNGVTPNGGLATGASGASVDSGALVRIAIPARHYRRHDRRGHYVSPATRSIAIVVTSNAGETRNYDANLTPSTNPNCTPVPVVCSLVLSLKPGKYTASIATYDGLLDGRHQPTGSELSANQKVSLTIVRAHKNVIAVALGGLPASISIFPSASSTLTGTVGEGFGLSRCGAGPQKVYAYGVDADGNLIIGAGAPTMSIKSGDVSLAVSSPAPATPNTFTFTPPSPPSFPYPGLTVFLTAGASPAADSGGRAATLLTKVTFSSNICGVLTEFPLPSASSGPRGLAIGPDNAIWFTERTGDRIGRITTAATRASPNITEYSIPTAFAGPTGIATGPDGALWFTECYAGQIGRLPLSGSPIFEFPTGEPFSGPTEIVAGPDRAMWFTERATNNVGRIATSGRIVVQEFPAPTASSAPTAITVGNDGALWFTEASGDKIGRIPVTGPPMTEFPVGSSHVIPRGIANDASGNIWFTECSGGRFGWLPTSGSPVTTSSIAGSWPLGITLGPDGAMWIAEGAANLIASVTTSGVIATYPVPTASSQPAFIITGPDGALWFTEFTGNKIGRIQ
jgi:virginiamycin B lyase